MVKKAAIFLTIAAAGILPGLAFAAASITVNPTSTASGNESSSAVSFYNEGGEGYIDLFDATGDNVSGNGKYVGNAETPKGWGAIGLPTSLSSGVYTILIVLRAGPPYDGLDAACGSGGTLALCQASETNPGYIATSTIEITSGAPPSGGGLGIEMPEGFASALTANIGAQVGDQGTLLMICLVAGVPLAFYVMKELIGLLPRNRTTRKGSG